jgi:hypothetical protein
VKRNPLLTPEGAALAERLGSAEEVLCHVADRDSVPGTLAATAFAVAPDLDEGYLLGLRRAGEGWDIVLVRPPRWRRGA